ncbi:MAG TPA: hypothetical protein VFE51_04320 [Verrucomicrobiae bacterium]|nr:hypothetical protein [Verrucomicrobiae bacterium]
MAVFLAALLVGCGKQEEKNEAPKEPASEKTGGEAKLQHGTNGEVIVTLDTNLQQTMGLQTTALEAAQVSPELKAYGRVMDTSGLAALTAELVTAEAAEKASQAELQRLKTLAAQSNASERSVQAAQATAVHDQAQAQSVRLRLLAAWGSTIAQRKDLPEFVQSLGLLESALVELDVPASEAPSDPLTQARLFTLRDESKPLPAQLLGPAPAVDPQMQGRGFLLLVSPNPLRLVPGAALTGYLSLAGEARSGILLPRSAIVRFGGSTWVYLQISDDVFQRQSVVLDTPMEEGWFVGTGLKPHDKVVTVGAQQLLSEELKGQGGGEQ